MNRLFSLAICCIALIGLNACSKQEPTTSTSAPHAHDDGQAHGSEPAKPANPAQASHGAVIELGTATIADWTVRASRDQGEIKPGGDAPIDAWLTGGSSKVIAVRFWIGVESAAGSIKARADIENPAEPNHWHTHAEIPNPMPPDSSLWVEIEIEGQGKKVGSFSLNS